MVKVDLKGLYTVRMPKRTYYYAWRGGPRILAPYGTPEFHAEFMEAARPTDIGDKTRFKAWVTLYKSSPEWRELAETTRRVWEPWLDAVKEHFGELRMRQFDRPIIRQHIRRWRDKWRDRPRAADTAKQVLSRVLSFAAADGAIARNPCTNIPNLYHGDRSNIIWLPEDLDHLAKSASKEVMYAARLASLTGLRQGDLLGLSWTEVGANSIERKTGKSRGRKAALIPLYADLRALLSAIPKRSPIILTNHHGKPWKGFGSSWAKAMKDAWPDGRDLNFHDLRGTAATNFFRADFSIREIAEIMAWSEDKVERLIDRYVKRDELLKDRVRRMDEARQKRLTSVE
ncbi:MAG: tyrosine-type recombinase/integrase [Alphaproteobacteria bacterium]|nr:tyrosine-type recombinase/integrase [Alphaproteobacteria bacterium]MDE2492404.1 tyrosine-type recombinase/integrase [Alphaproteobacteria bacterium]